VRVHVQHLSYKQRTNGSSVGGISHSGRQTLTSGMWLVWVSLRSRTFFLILPSSNQTRCRRWLLIAYHLSLSDRSTVLVMIQCLAWSWTGRFVWHTREASCRYRDKDKYVNRKEDLINSICYAHNYANPRSCLLSSSIYNTTLLDQWDLQDNHL